MATRGTAGQAFSSGQAARYCYVTADTIANWIRSGALKAQRTAGGQYRIRAEDLRTFMTAHGMSTELIDAENDLRPTCWQFHGDGDPPAACRRCIVYRSNALNCFALRGAYPDAPHRIRRCDDCDYYRRYSRAGGHLP